MISHEVVDGHIQRVISAVRELKDCSGDNMDLKQLTKEEIWVFLFAKLDLPILISCAILFGRMCPLHFQSELTIRGRDKHTNTKH
jgi:hypothetical protein